MYRSRIPEITATLEPRVLAALKAGAESIEQEAKGRVPVDTGHLRDSIHTDMQGDDFYVIAGDDRTPYGMMVEFGTVRTPAKPYLIPALEARRGQIVASVLGVMKTL